jgi:hypothetical protein
VRSARPVRAAGAAGGAAQTDPLLRARPDYINWLYDPAPTPPPGTTLAQPASVALFSGNVGTSGGATTPADGQIHLLRSVIGQPVGGVPLAPTDILPGSPEVVPVFVAVNGRGNVTVSPQTNLYLTGQTLTLTATPRNTNWTRFLRWSDGDTNATRVITVGLTNVFTAIFTNFVPLEELVFQQWDAGFGGAGSDALQAVEWTRDGGCILGGFSNSGQSGNKGATNHGDNDFWIIKLDGQGARQWERTFGGAGNDGLLDVHQTADDGFILGGWSESGFSGNKESTNYGYADYWLVKLDSNGNKQWEQVFGGTAEDYLVSAQQTSDGGYILAGQSDSDVGGNRTLAIVGGDWDFWLVKVDANGNKQWERAFGGDGSDELLALRQTRDGGFLLGGSSQYSFGGNKTAPVFGAEDYWLVKTDAGGNKQWEAASCSCRRCPCIPTARWCGSSACRWRASTSAAGSTS